MNLRAKYIGRRIHSAKVIVRTHTSDRVLYLDWTTIMVGRSATHCDQRVCMSVCPLACLKNHMSKHHDILRARYLWPRLGPPLPTMQYHYILPVLWTISIHIIEHMWCKVEGCQSAGGNAETASVPPVCVVLSPDELTYLGRKPCRIQRSLAMKMNNAFRMGCEVCYPSLPCYLCRLWCKKEGKSIENVFNLKSLHSLSNTIITCSIGSYKMCLILVF